MNKSEPELAYLAQMTNVGINSNIDSRKSAESLGRSIDPSRFVPALRRNPQQQFRRSPVPVPPRGNNLNYNFGQENSFDPVPLPSSPESMLPIPKGAEDYIGETYSPSQHTPDPEFQRPDLSGPSFKDTNFLKPSIPNQSSPKAEDSVYSMLKEQKEDIEYLKRSIKTLNRNLNKLIKQLNEQNPSSEG